MKTSLILAILPVAIVSALSINLYRGNIADKNLLVDYKNHVQQLLSQAEKNSKDRISQEQELAKLRNELDMLNNELATRANQLTITEEKAPPHYQEIEPELREKIIYEYELNKANKNSDSRLDLISEITSLDPSVLDEIMSLQSQFGPFIQALDVSKERMEEIVGVLTNYVAGQTQARQQVMLQAQSEQIDRREVGIQMRAIMNPTVMYEALSYDLSQNEISILQQTREQQRSRTRGAFRGGPRGTSGRFR